ncbi:hypothetical protein AB0K09_11425 [Streptomyces sp. NPDC049577]|uniref:hypothetical protein n=1 Tax=Streptomyces sp. NPDC049577 TaxID=3155153 RepID=UPI003420B003
MIRIRIAQATAVLALALGSAALVPAAAHADTATDPVAGTARTTQTVQSDTPADPSMGWQSMGWQ